MEAGAERLAAIAFLLTGISHLVAPRAWSEVFAGLSERGAAGSLAHGFIHLPLGIMVAAFHPVWTGPGLVLTLIGWSLLLKSTIYLVFTRWGAAQLRKQVSITPDWKFRVAGAFGILLALYCIWLSIGAPLP